MSRQDQDDPDERNQSGSSPTTRVMVLADVRLYREGLTSLLAAEPRLTV